MPQPRTLKNANRILILNKIKEHGAIARKDIANLTGLSRATVTHQTADLIGEGLVYEKQEGLSEGGRRPILLALTTDKFYVIGIKLMKTQAVMVLTDLKAEIIADLEIELLEHDPISVSQTIIRETNRFLDAQTIDRAQILGVGVGIAGLIDAERGICHFCTHHDWYNVPFACYLEQGLDLPVYIDNDVITVTMYEKLYGYGQGGGDFMLIILGYGVGMGAVMGNRVFRGASGFGSEFGHTIIDPRGELCHCGRRGCLETLVAEPWLVKQAQQRGLPVTTPDDLARAAQNGDPVALNIYNTAGRTLGQAMTTLVTLFNPKHIIFSGESLRASKYIYPEVKKMIRQGSFGNLGQNVELVVEHVSDPMWARGAASLVLEHLFRASEQIVLEKQR
jgi:predicted NBD/HSP70 family sugar kinase